MGTPPEYGRVFRTLRNRDLICLVVTVYLLKDFNQSNHSCNSYLIQGCLSFTWLGMPAMMVTMKGPLKTVHLERMRTSYLIISTFYLIISTFYLIISTFLSHYYDFLSHYYDFLSHYYDFLSHNFDFLSHNYDLQWGFFFIFFFINYFFLLAGMGFHIY